MRSRALGFGLAAFLAIPAVILGCIGCGKPVPTDPVGTGQHLDPLEAVELNGQGATFVKPILDVWKEKFIEKTDGKVKINYTGTGSGAGVTQMTKKLADFGCSDNPMTSKQMAEVPAGAEVVHIPLVVGAVVPAYNLPGVSEPLKFTGPLLVEIFTGKIAKWNDAKIAALNPGIALPDLAIQPVFRARSEQHDVHLLRLPGEGGRELQEDGGREQRSRVAEGRGHAQSKSDGVAGHISRTEGAIGYIELTFALESKDKMKYGSVKNKAGKDVIADLDSITAAADASLDLKQTQEPYSLHQLAFNLTDASGEKSYPIAGMSFAVLYKKQDGAKGKAVVAFLRWATSAEGQTLAKRRNYAPLPESLRAKIGARLDTIE